jgi:hypothetical protein
VPAEGDGSGVVVYRMDLEGRRRWWAQNRPAAPGAIGADFRESARFEQSFSDDGGKTWEPNWITTQVRVEK